MPNWAKRLSEELAPLRTARDELRVQLHLAGLEAKEHFERAEQSWHKLEGKLGLIRRESAEPLHEFVHACRDLALEIREAYRQIRKLL